MNNYYQGLRAIEHRDYARAIGFFSRALAIDAADLDSLAERGLALLEIGDFQQARADCQAVLERNAGHSRGCELLERLSAASAAQQAAASQEVPNEVAVDFNAAASASQLCVLVAPGETVFGYETSASTPPTEIRQTEPDTADTDGARDGHGAAIAGEAAAADPAPLDPADAAVSGTSISFDSAGASVLLVTAADEYDLAPQVLKREAIAPASSPASAKAAPARAKPAADDGESPASLPPAWDWRSTWMMARAGVASALVHAALLVALAMLVVHVRAQSDELVVLASTMPATGGEGEPYSFAESQDSTTTDPIVPYGATMVAAHLASVPKLEMPAKLESRVLGAMELALADRGVGKAEGTDLLREYVAAPVTEFTEVRSEEGRRAAILARGGTPESEAAVNRALAWLMRHQNYDGSWNFDHRFCGDCKGACQNPGSLSDARVGATAMALLPFLGAGHTHLLDKYGEGGKYAKTVLGGLRYLMRSMRKDGGMNEPAGRMYDHGLASIVLCEAYGMTHDRMLLKPAERSLAFIVFAQDPVGGGWRYQPQMPGDTSVVGWQVMALKSGQMAYLRVPDFAINGASRFLDSVAMDQGSGYGYVNNFAGTDATSAVGLLCRMYFGWKRDNPALTRGVQALSTLEPSTTNMYFNYYATQVLHHYEGPLWTKWNDTMRDYLVRSQSDRGHESGSWYFDGDRHGSRQGGRLYTTSLAAMTLEVYYRHMPLYSQRAVRDKLGP